VRFWQDLEDGVRVVVQHGGVVNLGRVKIDKHKAWLRILLPSGRFLSYPGVDVDDKGLITYLGQNQYTRQWCRINTYGGKLAENITQALCRDLLAEALVEAEGMGLGVVLHVHDDLVAEDAESLDELVQVMTDIPWAEDLPLAVAGFQTTRYHKD
jgi:DNA polymerase